MTYKQIHCNIIKFCMTNKTEAHLPFYSIEMKLLLSLGYFGELAFLEKCDDEQ